MLRHPLVETIDQCAQIINQKRLGLAHGFFPRLGVANTSPHTSDCRVLAIERIAGVTVAHDHRAERLIDA
jgi:hypothetical protein